MLFDVVELQDICGVTVPVDVDTIDFRSAKVSSTQVDDLITGLRLLPNLKSADLHGSDLTWEDRLKLCHE